MTTRLYLLLLPALAVLACGKAMPEGQALVGVTVIDGLGNPPLPNQVVVLRDGRIAEVTPADGWRAPRGTQAIRLPGRCVMPGLIDTRTRVTSLDRAAAERVLRTLLAFGITTVGDPAAPGTDGLALRQATASGEIVGPRILAAEDVLSLDAFSQGAPWPPAARQHGGSRLRGLLTWLEQVDFDGPELRERISVLGERRIPVNPTLLAYDTKLYGDDPRHRENPELNLAPAAVRAAWTTSTPLDDRTPEDFALARQAWPRLLELTRRMHEGGVLVTAGSDLPDPWVIPGVSLHQELALLHDAGILPLDVLRIATHHGAVALGLGDEVGSVTPGKAADLVVLAADPTALVSNTRAISHVFLGGRFFDPAALLAIDPP